MSMAIAKTPRDIPIRVAEFLREGNLEGIVSMFHPDCQIFFPPGEPPKLGLQGAREVFTDFVKMKPILISEATGEVINGDTALLQANWKILDQEGNLLSEGSSTEIAKKLENGGWGYFVDCPMGLPSV